MILLDTTVLVYAVGTDHPLQEPCRALIEAVTESRVQATTTVEVVQEFVHVRARRRGRADAARLGRLYAELLGPLLAPTTNDLLGGLTTFQGSQRLGAFDAVLATVAIDHDVDALVSADRAYAEVPDLRHVVPDAAGVAGLID